ncbi:hypothetical protein BDZ94DRAFT_1249068, partial [Collybia nuda]
MGVFFSKKFDPSADLQDLTGKVAIVTGGKCVIPGPVNKAPFMPKSLMLSVQE